MAMKVIVVLALRVIVNLSVRVVVNFAVRMVVILAISEIMRVVTSVTQKVSGFFCPVIRTWTRVSVVGGSHVRTWSSAAAHG